MLELKNLCLFQIIDSMRSVIDFGNINLRAHTFKIKAELRVAFVMQLKHV